MHVLPPSLAGMAKDSSRDNRPCIDVVIAWRGNRDDLFIRSYKPCASPWLRELKANDIALQVDGAGVKLKAQFALSSDGLTW